MFLCRSSTRHKACGRNTSTSSYYCYISRRKVGKRAFGRIYRPHRAMESEKVNIVELLSVCVDLARTAGREIRKIALSGNINAVSKAEDGTVVGQKVTERSILEEGADPVTLADITAQQIIEGSLRHYYPNVKLVGEEDIDPKDFRIVPVNKNLFQTQLSIPSGYEVERLASDLCIFVDPLDATKEFVLGNAFCVITLIGIAEKGVPIAGVMYQPFVGDDGTTYWALTNIGAGDSSPLSPEGSKRVESQKSSDEVVLVTSRLHSSAKIDTAISKINPDKVVRAGGAAYKVLTLLKGETDVYAYPQPGTKKWDTCAPEAILTHYGGKVTDSKGKPIPYFANSPPLNQDGILCTRIAATHEHFVKALNS